MGISSADFLEQFKRLLPPGAAWDVQKDSVMEKFFASFADEASVVNGRTQGLFTEAIPYTTTELLPEWEDAVIVKDECLADVPQGSVGERRAAVVAALRRPVGQSTQFYIDLAASLGFEISIIKSCPFRSGQSSSGDAITGPTAYNFMCGFSCSGQQIGNHDVGWTYYWTVVTSEFNEKWFESGQNSSGDPIRTFGNEVLECVLNAAKPAHTKIIFRFV